MKYSQFNQIIANSMTKTQLMKAINSIDLSFGVDDFRPNDLDSIHDHFEGFLEEPQNEMLQTTDTIDPEVPDDMLKKLQALYSIESIISAVEDEVEGVMQQFNLSFPATSTGSGNISISKGYISADVMDQIDDEATVSFSFEVDVEEDMPISRIRVYVDSLDTPASVTVELDEAALEDEENDGPMDDDIDPEKTLKEKMEVWNSKASELETDLSHEIVIGTDDFWGELASGIQDVEWGELLEEIDVEISEYDFSETETPGRKKATIEFEVSLQYSGTGYIETDPTPLVIDIPTVFEELVASREE